MDVKESYDNWADHYDSTINKTRDLEAVALKECLANMSFRNCLEIGCGTGKNTSWLITKAQQITAVDLSAEMLSKAMAKIISEKVSFIEADINQEWTFANETFDLITFSLVLEHIEDIDSIFKHAYSKLNKGGYIYVGELHPFKQYSGSKARFETEKGVQIVPCFTHNFSDFTRAALNNGLLIIDIKEYFDDNDNTKLPRVLAMLFHRIQ